MLATTSPPRTSPNPVEGKAGGSSTPAPRHEVANKRTLMEAAMSDPADAGEDNPPETAYGPPPDPPKTAWTPVGVQPGERAWSCPRAQSAHKFNVRKTGLMKLGCPSEDVDAISYFHAFFPMRDMEDAIALMNERATAGELYLPTPFTTAEFHVFLGGVSTAAPTLAQIRSVCNICMEPVCNSTVPRKCFAVHFVRHLKALGWTAPK
eukprot:jgi/Tetstr1/443214/TSEL_031254.t1